MSVYATLEPWRAWFLHESRPGDNDRALFLQSAFDAMGRAIHGEVWTGHEILDALDPPHIAPDAELVFGKGDDDRIDLELVRRYENAMRGYLGRPPLSDDDPALSREEWQLAWAEAQRRLEAYTAARQRRDSTAKHLVERAQSAALATFYRAKGGGEYVSVPPAWWQVDDPFTRLRPLALSIERPFDLSQNCDAWLFVDRVSLDQFVKGYRPAVVCVTARAAAVSECTKWLEAQLLDPGHEHTPKDRFKAMALAKWEGRLSERAFNESCWRAATVLHPGRNLAGRRPRLTSIPTETAQE